MPMRWMIAALLAALLALGERPAQAMGEAPTDEQLCYLLAIRIRSDPEFRPTPAEMEKLRQPAVERFAFLEALLATVEADLDLADVEVAKTGEEELYVQALQEQMQLLIVELDRLELELECWDEVLKWARFKIIPEPEPPIIWTPGEPDPVLPPDPLDKSLDELWEAIARYHGWLVVRREDAEQRAQALLVAAEENEGEAVVPLIGNRVVELRLGGGGALPLNKPDFGQSQELKTDFGGFVDFGAALRWPLSPRTSVSLGVSGGWDSSGLDRLENKNQPGTLPLGGSLSAWNGLLESRLYLSPDADWELFLGGGLGGAYRQLDLEANGNQIVDDGGAALAWKAEAGAAVRLCDCGLFAEAFLRYRGLGGTTVEGPGGDLDLGAQHDLFLGLGLRWQLP